MVTYGLKQRPLLPCSQLQAQPMQSVGHIVFRHLALATGIEVAERLLSRVQRQSVGAVGIRKAVTIPRSS